MGPWGYIGVQQGCHDTVYIVHLGLAGGHHHVDLGAALRAAVVVLRAEGEGAGVSTLQVQHLSRIQGVKTTNQVVMLNCFISSDYKVNDAVW